MPTPTVSIIIPSFNEGVWLPRTVRAVIEKTDYPDFEVIVVADGCTDNSVSKLKAGKFPNLKILELETSQGAIVARNRGAELAGGEGLVFIDSHQEPLTPNWLRVLVQLLERPKCGAATVNITSLGEKDRLGFMYTLKDWTLEPTWVKPDQVADEALTPAIPGGCFALKKTLFDATGGFNAHLKKWGREDFEYSLRLWRLGYDLYFSAQAVMGHAFDHKRQFKISWEQVDFNSLWIAHTLMDQAAQAEVEKAIKSLRPKTFAAVQAALKTAEVEVAKAQLTPGFKREFSAYRELFLAF